MANIRENMQSLFTVIWYTDGASVLMGNNQNIQMETTDDVSIGGQGALQLLASMGTLFILAALLV